MRGYHDLGGEPAGAVDREEHELAHWEKEVDALRMLLGDDKRRVLTSDQMRYMMESIGAERYFGLSYYERWAIGMKMVLVGKGLLTEAEIDARVEKLRAAKAAP